MIELRIKNQDTSVYWTVYFDEITAAQKWYATEITRPYWIPTRVAEYYDDGDLLTFPGGVPTINPARKAIRDQAKADLLSVKTARDLKITTKTAVIKLLKGKDLSAAEIKTAIEAIIELMTE